MIPPPLLTHLELFNIFLSFLKNSSFIYYILILHLPSPPDPPSFYLPSERADLPGTSTKHSIICYYKTRHTLSHQSWTKPSRRSKRVRDHPGRLSLLERTKLLSYNVRAEDLGQTSQAPGFLRATMSPGQLTLCAVFSWSFSSSYSTEWSGHCTNLQFGLVSLFLHNLKDHAARFRCPFWGGMDGDGFLCGSRVLLSVDVYPIGKE